MYKNEYGGFLNARYDEYPDMGMFPFRSDDVGGNPGGFDRDKQIRMCAQQLEALRDTQGVMWWELCKPNQPRSTGAAEMKKLIKHLIRVSSESVDFYATVDFVTRSVHQILRKAQEGHSKQLSLLGHLQLWGQFTHEHMVPGEAVFQLITDPAHRARTNDLNAVTGDWSFRALVTGTKRRRKDEKLDVTTEAGKLDATDYNAALPISLTFIDGFDEKTIWDIPRQYYPLLRYDAVGLLPQLIPVSARAKRLLPAYYEFKNGHASKRS